MESNKLSIAIPALIVSKTNSVEATKGLKQLLSQVFTEFFKSDTFGSLSADTQQEVATLHRELNVLIDLVFTEKVTQRAANAGTLKPRIDAGI
jgi:hypothetical protein